MAQSQKEFKTCFYCNGHELVADIEIGASADSSTIGLRYTLDVPLLKHANNITENLYAELCKTCSSVRFYVKNSSKPWKIS